MTKSLLLKALLIIFAWLLSFSGFAQQIVDESMPVDKGIIVEVEHVKGKMKILGWDKDVVSVVGTLSENTDEFIFDRRGNTVRVIVKEKRTSRNNWYDSDSKGDDLVIHIPQTGRLDYTTTNTDVQLSNIHGGVDAEVVNGDMRVENVSGRVRLEAVNGDISVQQISGEMNIETVNGEITGSHQQGNSMVLSTVNGDIDMASVARKLEVETVNGDIKLKLAEVSEIELSSVNGDMDVAMHLLSEGYVSASTVGGKVDLAFQPDVAARFEIEGHAGGSIKNQLSDDKPEKAKYGPRRWLDFATQNATANVDVSTVNGRVILRKTSS